jgi:hypothetical protein
MALANSDSWYCVTQRSICFVCERPLSTSDGHRFFGHLLPLDLLAESDSQDSIERRDSSTADQYRIPHYHHLGTIFDYSGFPRAHMSWIVQNKNISEARREMISGFPIHALSALRLMRTETQATFLAPSDHEENIANRLVQLIAGRSNFRAEATVTWRSGTGPADRRAGRVPSLPFRAIHYPRQPAIPDEGRSPEIYASGDSPF